VKGVDVSSIRTEIRDNGVAVITLDHPDKPVNTLSPALLEEFQDKVAPLQDDPAVLAMVLASAKPTFIAGADLDVLDEMEHADQAAALSRDGNALLSRIAGGRKPVVAAVHGAALGGGLEVALACHYILASDDPATVLGLPEVMLGLLPAGGGTQRLVQRVGLVTALPMMLTGQRVRARKAYRIGLVDQLTTPGGITETAVAVALQLAEGRLKRRQRKQTMVDRLAGLAPARSLILRAAARRVRGRTRGLYPAPFAILDCVATGLSKGEAAGLARESEQFGRLVVSPESRSLVWIFHAKNEIEKIPEDSPARPVRRLAILGAGFMGAGVASVSLARCPVVMRDISDQALAQGGKTVFDGLVKQQRSGAIRRSEADRRWSRLHLTTELDEIADADLVIEAVFEDLDLKRRVLAEVEARVAPDAVFASNTSALPIARIAAGSRHPERVLGMHYFSPVPKMPLLEIVVTGQTSQPALATARDFGTRQGKTCIVVKDGPGFYTTRILAPYLNEATLLLEEGARIEEIDRVLKDFGYPVGPVALIDEVGIDVAAHVAGDLAQAFTGRDPKTSDLLPRMFNAGYHGRKNGHGFYLYPARKKKRKSKQPNQAIYAMLERDRPRTIAAGEIRDRLALLMINEAVHCLQEEVIASPRDGDIGAIFGLGFPPMRGGPFHHVDAEGASKVVSRMQELAEQHGARFEPARMLADMARDDRRFYS
jgi:3-hydroxyacyl-CoA dehydrogenase/enoyl-CoA hydratase/carnithine racemase